MWLSASEGRMAFHAKAPTAEICFAPQDIRARQQWRKHSKVCTQSASGRSGTGAPVLFESLRSVIRPVGSSGTGRSVHTNECSDAWEHLPQSMQSQSIDQPHNPMNSTRKCRRIAFLLLRGVSKGSDKLLLIRGRSELNLERKTKRGNDNNKVQWFNVKKRSDKRTSVIFFLNALEWVAVLAGSKKKKKKWNRIWKNKIKCFCLTSTAF